MEVEPEVAVPLGRRAAGVWWGQQIGDALAMPVHWYYDPRELARDYGEVTGYVAPKNPHPGSILWRSHYSAPNAKGEILHDQARYWGQRGIHYHQFLPAGGNTLNALVLRELWASLRACGGWDGDDFLRRYVAFLTTPGTHRDTYREEFHRNFFQRYAQGTPPARCATAEKHIAGLGFLFPVLGWYADDLATGAEFARRQLALTHPGPRMEAAAEVVLALYARIVAGESPREAAVAEIARQGSPLLAGRWKRWAAQPTRAVLVEAIGTVCYVEQAIPAIVYLLQQHGDDPRQALIENINAGGDNAGRALVLGALLGAAYGPEGFPEAWRKGLAEQPGW